MITAGLCLGLAAGAAVSSQTIFFYNPETNVDNFATLKSEFDTYLASKGSFNFQPFSDRDTFEKTALGRPDSMYLLSSWHFSQLKSRLPLEPVLVGTSKGEIEQRKILTSKDVTSLAGLDGATVAGAGNEFYLRNILRQMLGPDKDAIADSVKVLTVPKDIDALMAVGFGVAKAAISSESSLQKLALINAKQSASLKVLATSEKSFLLIAAVPKQSLSKDTSLINAVESMGSLPEGERNLKLLGIDGWRRFDTLDPSLSKDLR